MLPRIHRLSCTCKYRSRKYTTTTEISTDTSPSLHLNQTFKKVTAYPFCVDPWHAQAKMDMVASMVKLKRLPDLAKLALYDHWSAEDAGKSSLLYSHYLKSKTHSSPLRIKALYFPVWKVWTCLSFVTVQRNAKLARTAITLSDRFFPGSHTPSRLAKVTDPHGPNHNLLQTLPLAECLSPFGLDVQCLPFTISPFAIFDMAKSTPKSQLLFRNEIIMTDTLRPDFFATFPVMFPFYTCEYTYPATKDRPEWKYELYMHAHGDAPRLAGLYPIPPWLNYKFEPWTNENGHIDVEAYPRIKFIDLLASVPGLRTDDDASIRVMTTEELEPITRYLNLRLACNKATKTDMSTWPKSARDEYTAELVDMHIRAEEYLPSWWRQSRLARQSSVKQVSEKKDKPLRSRSSPLANLKVDPTTPFASPLPNKKAKQKPS